MYGPLCLAVCHCLWSPEQKVEIWYIYYAIQVYRKYTNSEFKAKLESKKKTFVKILLHVTY